MRTSVQPIFESSAGLSLPKARGFTLVELMIVLFVIGLVAGAVVLNLPGDRSALSEDTDRFVSRVAAARDEAVIGQRPVAVWISPSGYGFEGRRDGRWEPLGMRGLNDDDWRSGTSARIVNGASPDNSEAADVETQNIANIRGRFYFDNTGLPNAPITIRLIRGEESDTVEIGATGEVARAR